VWDFFLDEVEVRKDVIILSEGDSDISSDVSILSCPSDVANFFKAKEMGLSEYGDDDFCEENRNTKE